MKGLGGKKPLELIHHWKETCYLSYLLRQAPRQARWVIDA